MSTDQPPLTADPQVAQEWLTHLYGGGPGLVSVCSDADGWAGRRFATDTDGLAAAVRYIVKLDRRRAKGIYAQSTTLRERPEEGRGGEDLAYGLTHLWADGDYGTIGHKPGPDDLPAPPDADAVAKVVAESGLPAPSGWAMTGGGYNPLWMLAENYVLDTAEDRARAKEVTTGVQAILAAQAFRYGWSWDVEVGNLDRLMKIPGTVNRKEGLERPTAIGPGSGEVFQLGALADVVAQLAPTARQTLDQAAREKQERKARRTGAAVPPPRSERPAGLHSGDGPLDVLADMLTFRDLLEPEGWTHVGQAGGREKWLRPTAGGEAPSSAYSLLCDDHVAVNWSERADLPVGAQPPGQKLTVGTLYAHLHYGGDTSAAASDILRAASGREARGAAAHLPHTVLAEVQRRCLKNVPPAPAADEPIRWDFDAEEPPGDTDEGNAPSEAPALNGHLPAEFYNRRPFLRHIRQAAHSRAAPADVVLYSFLARLSGMLSHHIRAETGIGTRASLNLFAASVGPSGAGKSTGKDCVRELMPPPDDEFRDGLPVGSGEGIAETFMGVVEEPTGEIHAHGRYKGDPVMRRVRKQVRHNAFFYVDEGQTLAQLQERSGATLAEALRRAAVGETLGQTNASEERTRYVPAGSYSLGLLIGLQPSVATVLLADVATGTPQRFWWAWAIDPSVPDEAPPWPGTLDVPVARRRPDGPVNITFPKRICDELRRERVARVRGEVDVPELDGHAGLMKVKMAALLALLADREAVTEEDWELAESMWAHSCAVRDSLVRRAQREAEAERKRQEDAKVQAELRAHLAKSDADRSLERVAGLVRKHASQVGGITFGYLNRALASRDRPLMTKAIDLAEVRGWVVVEGDRVCVRTE
ncbi:DUF3987 domain-containing protein [Streptomyces sp. NPDC001312]|uniref:DUF3987 domain-containing protein n=1 Tax=Streptomyces sp. NPDC001312 TaxID=3364561 RepID=UPI00367B55B9